MCFDLHIVAAVSGWANNESTSMLPSFVKLQLHIIISPSVCDSVTEKSRYSRGLRVAWRYNQLCERNATRTTVVLNPNRAVTLITTSL